MATINAPTLKNTAYSGVSAAAYFHGKDTLAAAASGTVVRLGKLFAGTKIMDMRMINAALGTSTTVKVGFEYVNGEAGSDDDGLLAATATNAAASTRMSAAPVTLQYDAYLIATIGGAAATGALDVVVEFEPQGK